MESNPLHICSLDELTLHGFKARYFLFQDFTAGASVKGGCKVENIQI